jgi:malate dehydrogenase (oxaloacetate-decarboxylating)
VVVLAALLNACKLTGRELGSLRVVVFGLGAAGVAVTKILLAAGVGDIVGVDSRGALHTGREDYVDGSLNPMKRWYAETTNAERRDGDPSALLEGIDLLIGVSGAKVVPAEALGRMNPDPMVFAMANPTPEVSPEEAMGRVRIMATGRSDYPNQINNVLAFPGIFRGALDVRASEINEAMKLAAGEALASVVAPDQLSAEYVIPSVFNREVGTAVAEAVAQAAIDSGVARRDRASSPQTEAELYG